MSDRVLVFFISDKTFLLGFDGSCKFATEKMNMGVGTMPSIHTICLHVLALNNRCQFKGQFFIPLTLGSLEKTILGQNQPPLSL